MVLGRQSIENLAKSLAALVARALEYFSGREGFLNRPFYGNVTAADLITSAVFLGLVLLVNAVVFAVLSRKESKTRAQESDESWRVLILHALRRPLHILLWIYGSYFAALPVLLHLPQLEGTHPIRLIFDEGVNLGAFFVLFWAFFRLTGVIDVRLRAATRHTASTLDDLIVPLLIKTLRVVIPVLGVYLGLPLIGLPPEYQYVITKLITLMIIGAVAWILVQSVNVAEDVVMRNYDIKKADNLRARELYTQVHVLKRTLFVVVAIFTIAAVLMSFEQVRQLGASILASAGVLGIIIGFAAQRTIANLFASFQLAMTQPIRLDDVVIVEGDFGRVEEITLTYVVIRVWDLRRIVLPITYFIEKPFQNWTRTSADLLGTVFIYTDYTVPVDAVRKEFERIVKGSPHWDGKVAGLQVTNATDRTLELRGLVSASDAGKAWDLRCEAREKIISYLQQNFPDSLPKTRASLNPAPQPPVQDSPAHPAPPIP